LHQYEWAKNNNLPFITWTFDPLVKRNARLNLLKLGVEIDSYHPNFYGAMIDDLNAGDESDRLMAKWLITDRGPQPREELPTIPDGAITIAIPDDIVEIRMRDVQETFAYRFEVREKFQRAFSSGYSVIGFSITHGYVLDKK
jgi:predicted GNAT superfamily acetyltransferase